VDSSEERIRSGTLLEHQAEISLHIEERLDVFDMADTSLVGPVVLLEIGKGGPLGNNRHSPDVPEECESSIDAHLRLHEPNFVASLDATHSICLERHLTGLVSVALGPCSKNVDELSWVVSTHASGDLTVGIRDLAHYCLLIWLQISHTTLLCDKFVKSWPNYNFMS